MANIYKANILLPEKNIDLSKWSVIACDQFTGDKKYWKDLENYVGDSPSTLNFIIPEALFEKGKIFECDKNITKSFNNNEMIEYKNSFILINRETPFHVSRLGLVCCIDLEDYDFSSGSHSLIRASEGTILERVIPRIDMRQKSVAEFPHIMLLYDDRKFNILENMYKNSEKLQQLYDFDLYGNGGHLTGFRVETDIETEFNKLLTKDYLYEINNSDEKLLFLVGDGNHSLATAKVCWENLKKMLNEDEIRDNPARYCLVEICNINDAGIEFYPIHRVIYNYTQDFIDELKNLYNGINSQEYNFYYSGTYHTFRLPKNTAQAISLVQDFIENYIRDNHDISVDYIHEKNNAISICDKENALGIFLPVLKKNEIFKYVMSNGALPKKSFSIGHSVEKRYYMEGRIIKN